MAALIRRFHEAKMAGSPTVTRSGTGSPLCECLHGDNLDEVCVMR
jgi:GDP-L-fucose synthase